VHGDQQELSAFRVLADGGLAAMNRVSCHGRNPVHLALDPSERSLVVSNHLSGQLAVIRLDAEGALGEVVQLESLPGEPGPHRVEQPFSKPHFNPFDPSGRFVLVPDKGLDRVFSFRFDGGRLVPAEQPWITTREGAGPRHLAFHPNLGMVYVLNELDATVLACRFDEGALEPVQVVSSLPETFTGNSRAAGIQVSADGRFVHASNRGADCISVFAVEAGGLLRFRQAVPSEGRTPRFFTLSPDGKHMYVLNEDSDSIARFGMRDGVPVREGDAVACGSPVCMVFKG
jgi:6-phosphogluconolactonase (cycloisomerase 2 family)